MIYINFLLLLKGAIPHYRQQFAWSLIKSGSTVTWLPLFTSADHFFININCKREWWLGTDRSQWNRSSWKFNYPRNVEQLCLRQEDTIYCNFLLMSIPRINLPWQGIEEAALNRCTRVQANHWRVKDTSTVIQHSIEEFIPMARKSLYYYSSTYNFFNNPYLLLLRPHFHYKTQPTAIDVTQFTL